MRLRISVALLAVTLGLALIALSSDRTRAVVPGANGKIAFDSDRNGNSDIYVMNPDGSGQKNLTKNAAIKGGPSDYTPAWSPDGRRIAFTSTRTGTEQIWVMNADGSNPVNVTKTTTSETEPAWSPDGKKIAFASHRDGNFEVYVMNADGSDQVNLSRTADSIDAGAAWSPDGTKIAFFSTRDDLVNTTSDIYVMDANGDNQTPLTSNSVDDDLPAWSPDGTKIAYSSRSPGPYTDVWVMDPNGMNKTPLTMTGSVEDFSPAWSPDGKFIAFTSERAGNFEIYKMSADGSNEGRVTNVAGRDSDPDWGVPTPSSPPPPGTTGPANAAKLELLASRVRVNRRGRGRIRARCDNVATDVCTVALTIRMRRPHAASAAARRIRIGRVRGHLAGQQTGRLSVRLNRRGRHLLRERHRLRTRARGTSKNEAGTAQLVSRRLVIRRKRR